MAGFPKSVRILRSKDFRRIYEQGSKYAGPLFAAFYARRKDSAGPRVGFTVPRAVGSAVARNRIKRRLREAVRLHLERLSPKWEVVINPRQKALSAPFPDLEREIEKLFARCGD